MSMKKPKVTINLNLDERLLLGACSILLLLSMLVLIVAAIVGKPALAVLGFVCLGLCFYCFTLLCKWRKPLSGSKAIALVMAGLFLTLSMLALYGVCGAMCLDEQIAMAILGILCFITFLVFFTFFCKWQKVDLLQ